MSYDLIVFGEDWGRHPSSTQHLMKCLAKDRKIIWVNSIGMRRPRFSLVDMGRVLNKVRRMFAGRSRSSGMPVPENMIVVEPRVVSLPGNATAAWLNRHVLGRTLRRIMKKNNIVNPILWTSLPTAVDLLGICDEKAVVYYCGDEFGALAGVDHKSVLKCEHRLVAAADLIIAASKPLAAKFSNYKTRRIPHGVDFHLFATPTARAKDLPTRGPIAGFYGSLSDWLDQDLIVQIAKHLSNWTFVFIGDERTDLSRIRKLPNVRLLGVRSHDVLPSYVQHWDVSIMPFIDNEQIRNCNPLKLREYLAAGRPIVATPFPAMMTYEKYLQKAATASEFVMALECALRDKPGNDKKRKKSVQNAGWPVRAKEVSSLIDEL